MTIMAAKNSAPVPSFVYELAMTSRKAFLRRSSSSWLLSERETAHKWGTLLGWRFETDEAAPVGAEIPVSSARASWEFFCFYGEVGLIARRHEGTGGVCRWFLADGSSVDPGIPATSDSNQIPPHTSTLKAVEKMSSVIPSPFIRIDVLECPEELMLRGFSPKPPEASKFNPQTDRRLGQMLVDATGRLHEDLLFGKRFPDFQTMASMSDPQRAELPASGAASKINTTAGRSTTSSGQTKKNYATWKLPHLVWASISEFDGAPEIVDGVHSIQLKSAVWVDVYIRGNPFTKSHGRAVLTFLAGAVTDREKKNGPFFTGLGIAADLDIPLISIADPTLDTNQNLGLAWFTGRQNEGIDDGITRILDSLADRARSELLLVGGSGGGFASLKFGMRLGRKCSVFVWNAQTDLLKYSPRFVRSYLTLGLGYSKASLKGSDWIESSRQRMEPELQSTVLEQGGGIAPRRLFYLQNADDWHVGTHFTPWLEANGFRDHGSGIYATDANHVGLLAMAAPGHQPPPVSLVSHVITKLRSLDITAQQVAEELLIREPICSQDSALIPRIPLS